MNYSGIIFALKDNDNGIKKSEKKNINRRREKKMKP